MPNYDISPLFDEPRIRAHLSRNLARLLADRQMTRRQLAEQAGLPLGAVFRALSGQATPTLQLLVPIASVLDVSLDELLGLAARRAKKNRRRPQKAS